MSSPEQRPRFFDAHCHLQFPVFDSNRDLVLRNARARSGVEAVAVNGCCEQDWPAVQALCEDESVDEVEPTRCRVVPNFGLHPWYLRDRTDRWLASLRAALEANPRAGLGECGLDRTPRVLRHTSFDEQTDLLVQQLRLAKELRRPVSLHCVKAWGRMVEVLRREGPFPDGVLLHSFCGPAEVVPGLCDCANAHFSISLSILRVKDQRAKAALNAVPLERLLLETDSPDSLCSAPGEWGEAFRLREAAEGLDSATNHPGNLPVVARIVARMTGRAEEVVAKATYQNAVRLFGGKDNP